MADSRQTKVVEYQLQGDTSNLTAELTRALEQLNALDTKLTAISASQRLIGGKDKTSFKRAATISSTLTTVGKLQEKLSAEGLTSVSPDQLNLLKYSANELEKIITKLGTFKNNTTVTQKFLDKTKVTINEVTKRLHQAGIEIDKVSEKTVIATSKWQLFKEAFSKFRTIAFTIRIIVHYFNKLYAASADYVEIMNLFNVATRESSEALSEFANEMAESYHADVGIIKKTISVFRQYGNTMGFTGDQADTLAKGLTQLTYDLASLYNTSNEDMFNALKSGLAGQTKTLMRYGISVHKATLENTAMRLGINKTWGAFSETEKVALRYIAILDQASLAQGDLARTIESPQNQMKILKAQLSVLLRNGGQFVVLIAGFILPALNALLITFNKFLEALGRAAGYEIPDYSDNLKNTNASFEDGIQSAEEYQDAIKGSLTSLDEINQQTGKDSANTALGVLDPKIAAELKSYDNMMDQISTKTSMLAEGLSNLFGTALGEGAGDLLGVAFDSLGVAIDAISQALVTLAPVLKVVASILGVLLQGVAWLVDNIVSPLLDFIKALTSNIWLLIGAFTALNLVQLAATGSAKAMIGVKVVEWIMSQVKALGSLIAKHIAHIAVLIKERAATIAAAVATWWETAALWQKAIALVAAGGIGAIAIAGIVAAATSKTRSEASQSQKMPALAAGGVVNSPTIALIGEGKYQEAVMPLGNSPQFTAMKDDIATAVLRKLSPYPQSGSTGGAGTPVILNINGREFARAILPDISRVQSQTGVKLKT